MNDIEFMRISKHIFDNKSSNVTVHSEFDNIQKLMNDDVRNKNELVLNLNFPDSSIIIDLLNHYSPNLDLKVVINNEEENTISKKIIFLSHFQIHFQVIPDITFEFGRLYNGKTIIDGDIDSVSLLRSIESSSPELVMRSDISINGRLRGDSVLFFEKLNEIVYNILNNNDDDSMFEMNISISGKIRPDHDIESYEKTNFIRFWEVYYETDNEKHIFSVKRILYNPQ